MEHHHLQERICCGQELPHHDLEELLAFQFLLFTSKLDFQFGEEGRSLVFLEVHNGAENLEYGVQNKLVEGTLQLLAIVLPNLGPLFGLWVEEIVALTS